jgi:hypothetical protein
LISKSLNLSLPDVLGSISGLAQQQVSPSRQGRTVADNRNVITHG